MRLLTSTGSRARQRLAPVLPIVLLAASGGDIASAQTAAMSNPCVGDLLRLVQRNGELLSGQVTRIDGAEFSLRERRTGAGARLDLDSVSSYERGIKAPHGRWAKRGALIGAGIGAEVTPVRWQPDVRVSSQLGSRGWGIGLRRSF